MAGSGWGRSEGNRQNLRQLLMNMASKEEIKKAAEIIRSGGLVVFPTETVYGLGANALDSAAIAKIYALKGRPAASPLIVHVSSVAQAREREAVIEELGIVEQRIDATPELGRLLHHAEVSFFGEGVQRAVAALEQIQHLDLHVVGDVFDGIAQIARGRVVAFPKSRRQDEHFFHGVFFYPARWT